MQQSRPWTNALLAYLFMIPLFLFMPWIPLLFLILPLPFIWVAASSTMAYTFALAVLSSITWMLWTGQPGVIYFIAYALIVGALMGIGYQRYRSALHATALGVLGSLGAIVGSIVLSYFVLGINWIGEVERWMQESVTSAEELLLRQGASVPWNPEVWTDVNLNVVPFILVAFSVIVVALNHTLAVRILPKKRVQTYRFPPLKDWQIPRSVVFYYVITFILSWIAGTEEDTFLAVATLNLLPLLTYVLAIQGLSFIAFWAHHRGKGRWISNVAVILFLLFPPLAYVYNLIGILDLGFQLRQRMQS